MEEQIEILEPIRYAQFETIEQYNQVNTNIAAWKDLQTAGEYTRTETAFEYNPEPEPAWNEIYYMEARPEQVEAGLFEGVVLLDAVPVEEFPTDSWLKADIQDYLTKHQIEWTTSMTKAQLLSLLQ